MVKIKVTHNGCTRTFYTRRDWKEGKKLYVYTPRSGPKLTGNWYTDPNYGHWSAQDYYKEYDDQCRGGGPTITSGQLELERIVRKNNDHLVRLANDGVKKAIYIKDGVFECKY